MVLYSCSHCLCVRDLKVAEVQGVHRAFGPSYSGIVINECPNCGMREHRLTQVGVRPP